MTLFANPQAKENARGRWIDRDCKFHDRADLAHILDNHKLWRFKYENVGGSAELAAHGAFSDPLFADLSGAWLDNADLSKAELAYADLSGAHLDHADLTSASLIDANLAGAHLVHADLTGIRLDFADLTHTDLDSADLTNAELILSDLTSARLESADLTRADFNSATLTGADLKNADLTGAQIAQADLTGADLTNADLTRANLYGADLSSSILQGTDLSEADLTRATLEYSDFEPATAPPINTMARADGLETLRWSGSFDEICYRRQLEKPQALDGRQVMAPQPSLPDRWMLWLSLHRERVENKKGTWQELLLFLRNDVFFHGQSKVTAAAAAACELPQPDRPSSEQPRREPPSTQGKYQVIDVRTALRTAGYQEDELKVNLAYQRHTQTTLGMILYDWTCEYGAAPSRPLFLALTLALLAMPVYWLGFRRAWFGSRLLRVEKRCETEVETLMGDPQTQPKWREPLGAERPANWLRRFIVPFWPRIRWEASFLKAIVLFSLTSVVNLGFEGLDFGRWVRSLFFREYDLKARGWLRAVSGLQSLLGLGLLALSLLSYFGHPFE